MEPFRSGVPRLYDPIEGHTDDRILRVFHDRCEIRAFRSFPNARRSGLCRCPRRFHPGAYFLWAHRPLRRPLGRGLFHGADRRGTMVIVMERLNAASEAGRSRLQQGERTRGRFQIQSSKANRSRAGCMSVARNAGLAHAGALPCCAAHEPPFPLCDSPRELLACRGCPSLCRIASRDDRGV